MKDSSRLLCLSLIITLCLSGMAQNSRADDLKKMIKWSEFIDAFNKSKLSTIAGEQNYNRWDVISFGPGLFKQPKSLPFFISPTDKKAKEPKYRPLVGFDGNNYLVVWVVDYALMGARVTPKGTVLDPAGFVINDKGEHYRPRLAFGKGNYLVVWETKGKQGKTNVRAALVSTTAKVSSMVQSKISDTMGTETKVTGNASINSWGTPVFPDAPDNLSIYQDWDALGSYRDPDVAFNGADFVVVCCIGDKVIARLVDPVTSEVRRETPIKKSIVYPWGKPKTIMIGQAGNTAYWSRIASGGGKRCLVTWNFTASPGIGELSGALVDFAGQSWTTKPAETISDKSMAAYGYCEAAASGTDGYFLAWHDMSEADKKKVQPSDTWEPDLFTSTLQIAGGNPSNLVIKSWGLFYTKKKGTDYYPSVDYGGLNYGIIWDSGGTDLKTELLIEWFGASWLEPESPEFWAKLDPNATEEAKKLLDCMNDFSILGAYISPGGSLVDAFGLLSADIAEPDWGLLTGNYDICFGQNEGLLVYIWHNQTNWNPTYPNRVIRGRFITKPNFLKAGSQVWKLGNQPLNVKDLLHKRSIDSIK